MKTEGLYYHLFIVSKKNLHCDNLKLKVDIQKQTLSISSGKTATGVFCFAEFGTKVQVCDAT